MNVILGVADCGESNAYVIENFWNSVHLIQTMKHHKLKFTGMVEIVRQLEIRHEIGSPPWIQHS